MEDSARSIRVINAIRDFGIRLAVDDFGTGYSAFAYLQQLPLDQIKIGQNFIGNIAVNTECFDIVKAIVDLSKRLGLSVIAEKIENERQLQKIRSLNIDMVQGFLFSRPVAKEAVGEVAHRFR